jgi:HEAT repeat protein
VFASLILLLAVFTPAAPFESDATDLNATDPARRIAAVVRTGTRARPADLQRLRPLLRDPDTALRLAAARILVRAGDPAALNQVIADAGDKQAPVRFLALTILREAAEVPEAGLRAAARALGDDDPAMRLVALDLLRAHPGADSAPLIAGGLADGNRDIRLASVRALGTSRDQRSVLPLLQRLDASDRIQRLLIIDALASLGRHPTLDAGPALVRQLDDPGDDVRAAAVEALGRLRSVVAVPALRTIVQRRSGSPDERSEAIARRAILALGSIGDVAAVDVLVGLLRQPAPVAEVGLALCRVGPPAVPAITRALPDLYVSSAIAAADVLAAIGDRSATDALIALLKTRPLVAITAARALGVMRDVRAVPALLDAIGNKVYAATPGVRRACLHALANIGDARAATVVESSAHDSDPDVRAAAFALATAVHAGPSRRALAGALTEVDSPVYAAAVNAAVALPTLRPGALLIQASNQPRAPAWSGDIDRGATADALERAVVSVDRGLLETALVQIQVRRAHTAPMQPASTAPTPSRRTALLRALAAALAQDTSVASLSSPIEALVLDALATGGPDARAAATVLAVASVRDATLAAVLSHVSDPDATIRALLCPALAHAGTEAADAALVALLSRDPDDGVRAAAAWAAGQRRAVPSVAAALTQAQRARVAAVRENARVALSWTRAARAEHAADGRPVTTSWTRIRLLDADGVPATGAWIRVQSNALLVWARTDDNGEARIADLPAGPYRVSPDDAAHTVWTVAHEQVRRGEM